MTNLKKNLLTHLQKLESESIHILREVASTAKNPVMLYSAGKDSACLMHLAKKAFYPSSAAFPFLHIDTTWKFREMYNFRDKEIKKNNFKLIVYQNPDAIKKNINPFDHGSLHTDIWKTEGLVKALKKYDFDVAIGGARRDEEKSRSKERIFSFRDVNNNWEPKNQRPEIWNIYNSMKREGESIRVFPLSNWTELDVWQYILNQKIEIPSLYFSANRPVIYRNNNLIVVDDNRIPLRKNEKPVFKNVRFRTLGCYPLTGAIESNATNLYEIISEMLTTNSSERDGRIIDTQDNSSMEEKKKEGYF